MPLSQYINQHLTDLVAVINGDQQLNKMSVNDLYKTHDPILIPSSTLVLIQWFTNTGIWWAIDLSLHPDSSLASKI